MGLLREYCASLDNGSYNAYHGWPCIKNSILACLLPRYDLSGVGCHGAQRKIGAVWRLSCLIGICQAISRIWQPARVPPEKNGTVYTRVFPCICR